MSPVRLPSVPPAPYFPFENGRYEVKAGLLQLGRHAVHGRVETHVFAFDREYGAYVTAKVESRSRGLHRYYQQAALAPDLRRAVLERMLHQLTVDSDTNLAWDGAVFRNPWLGWEAVLDTGRGTVERVRRFDAPLAHVVKDVTPVDALDFLGMNVQEDFAVVAREHGTHEDYLAALHVLFPQHWDPRDKIGRSFGPVHAPVAGSAPMISTAPRLVQAVIEKGPFLRFAWGVATSDRLDHHPASPVDDDRAGLAFAPDRTFVRVERQTLVGFPDQQGAFFTIRPYVYPLLDVARDRARREQLADAVASMTDEHLQYKGMRALRDPLLAWLRCGVERHATH